MSSRRGKVMKISSHMRQFNRLDSCRETILVRAKLPKSQFQEKTRNQMKQTPKITATRHMVMRREQRQMLKQKKMEVQV